MDSKQKLISQVKSPAIDAHFRSGNGFSLKEIKDAGKNIGLLQPLNIKIDFFRKSAHPENIEKLKSLKIPKEEQKKKKPFIKKEKKRTPIKPKIEKTKDKITKVIEKNPIKKAVDLKKKPVKKAKIKTVKIEKVKVEITGTPLTELTGLGAATVKKFVELGVHSIEELCKEKPEELAPLIKGVSAEKLKKWIEEGKEFLK